MKLNMAVLCDRATVREGLLHILGAGVTKTSLPLPSMPDLDLAILLGSETWDDFAGTHRIAVIVRHVDGMEVAKLELGWEAPNIEQQAALLEQEGATAQLPVVVPLRSVLLTQDGQHFIDILIDEVNFASVSLLVTKAALPGVTTQLR